MRNLKRTLSLALAAVMLMGMMVVGAGAASKDFTDASEIKNVEAVDVMVALGILEGGDKGDFQPNSILTREQAAKIICYMLLGEDSAEKLSTNSAVFNDVAADRWSAPYIGYCVNLGILAGDGQGNFFPEGKLTGAAFAKMLLVALGYDPAIEEYVGNSWTINVAADAIEAGISPKGVVLTDELSRQDAAQMAFQTLTATVVKYDNKGTTVIGSDGMQVIVGASSASAVANTTSNYDNTKATDNVMQFCEKYFSDLTKESATADDFGRPADYAWELKSNEVYTASAAPVATFNKAASADDVAAALKGYKLVNDQNTAGENDDVTYKVDNSNKITTSGTALTNATSGKILDHNTYDGTSTNYAISTNAANQTVAARLAEYTQNGRLVEFYANSDKEITAIVCVQYGVTQVTKVTTNKDGDVSYQLKNVGTYTAYANEDKTDEIILNGEVAKDDIVTYVTRDGQTYVYPTTKVVGAQSAFNEDKETITVSGTTYDVSTFSYDKLNNQQVDVDGTANNFPNSSDDANYYVDQFGLVVYSDAVASETKYTVINAIAKVNGLSDSIEAELIFADGSREVVTVKSVKDESGTDKTGSVETTSNGTEAAKLAGIVYTYTVKDGKYELTAVPTSGGKSVAKEPVSNATVTEKGNPDVNLATDITTNNSTVFVVKYKSGSDTLYATYTGFKAVPTITAGSTGVTVDYAKNGSGTVEFVYIDATAAGNNLTSNSEQGDIVYITSTKYTTALVDDNTVYYYNAIINGEKGTLATDSTNDSAASALAVGLYKVTAVNDDNVATSIVKQATAAGSGDDFYAYTTLTGSKDAKDGVVVINNTTYTYDGSETVYVIDADGNVTEGTVDGLDIGTNTADYKAIYVKEVDNTTTAKEINTIYVVMK
ncbi:S-layer homology domain-containing protein [Flavonifractor sp. An112]|uniref:S-layer homology domain-containing protein n=1 Tax=Flavonifractor sp. An112 TaxID=1965544 RepID=UPI001302E09D|nr:S-layer homology domain-containing protein [Flavonifractor sp. An112]